MYTWQTDVVDVEELVVSARVVEERRVDGERAPCVAATHGAQRMLDVDLAPAVVRHATSRRAARVVATVARPGEHQQVVRARTRQLQDRVETGVATSPRPVVSHCNHVITAS